MNFCNNPLYQEDLRSVTALNLPWDLLQNKSFFISGATGLVGKFFVDTLMMKNEDGLNCKIYALSRNSAKAADRFSEWKHNTLLQFIPYDVKLPFVRNDIEMVDYVLHMASNTHPMLYSTDPIGTIATNIIGLQNMLNFAVEHRATRFVFTSSNEIYGENRGDVELFNEEYCGYINCNTIRAGYPESKRCGEALCQAYKAQKGLDVVIPRITRTYGPTMSIDDTKAASQFIKKAVAGENIILKSSGTQFFSYTYMADAVSGLLYVILKGENGEAYNVADTASDITLKDLASMIANISGTEVIFKTPDAVEALGYSRATKARLDASKLKKLGWQAKYDIRTGLERTISMLKPMFCK